MLREYEEWAIREAQIHAWSVHPGNPDSRTALSVFSHLTTYKLPLYNDCQGREVLMIEQLHKIRPIIRPWNVDVEISRSMCSYPGQLAW